MFKEMNEHIRKKKTNMKKNWNDTAKKENGYVKTKHNNWYEQKKNTDMLHWCMYKASF